MVYENDTLTDAEISDSCPENTHNNINETNSSNGGELDWDEKTQGLVLGGFYYGYACTNLLGGLAAERWGGTLVMGLGMGAASIFSLLTPIAAKTSTWLVILDRVLIGAASGVSFPAVTSIIANWYPTSERSKYASIIFAGVQLGTVVVLPLTGLLCDSSFLGGWPAAYYVFGVLGLIWVALWFYLIRDDPRDHPRISPKELNYIVHGCPAATKNMERMAVPWMKIFKSKEFWAIAAGNFGNNWTFYTLLTELPTYLDKIQHFNIKSNGALSALPYLGSWLFSIGYSSLFSMFVAKQYFSLRTFRRLSMGIGNYGVMLGFITMCFVNCNSTMAILVLFLGQAMNGAIYSGYMCSHADISPRFAGTLMGLTNTLGSIPGFVSPAVVGAITQDNQTLWAWREVFLIAALITFTFNTIYIVFVSTEKQPWNEIEEKKQ